MNHFMKYLLVAAALALATPAAAVDLTAPVNQFNGKPLTDAQGNPTPKTLGQIIEETLLITEPTTTPAEKMKRFWLSFKIHDKAEASFTPEEIVMIKDVLGRYQTILIAGQAVRLLDPTSVPGEATPK